MIPQTEPVIDRDYAGDIITANSQEIDDCP